MKDKKKTLNKGIIMECGLVAMMASIGLLFFGLFLFDISVNGQNSGFILAINSALTTMLWVLLLFRNC